MFVIQDMISNIYFSALLNNRDPSAAIQYSSLSDAKEILRYLPNYYTIKSLEHEEKLGRNRVNLGKKR